MILAAGVDYTLFINVRTGYTMKQIKSVFSHI